MRLASLTPSVTPSLASERRDASVLRVHLHALFVALRLDNVPVEVAHDFRSRWKDAVKQAAPFRYQASVIAPGTLISFRLLLRSFKDALRPHDQLLSARGLPSRIATSTPWSFQTHYALQFWFDEALVPQVAKAPRLTPTDAARISQAFKLGFGLRPGAQVGRPGGTLWVTCDIRAGEQTMGVAGRLRDALGLLDRRSTEYAFLVQLGTTLSSIAPVHAPTTFDADGYPRFRPWPGPITASDADVGRTYDLDSTQRIIDGTDHGRQEMVVKPLAVANCVDLFPIGHIGWDADDSPESFEAYADEVEPGASVRDLVEQLDRL